MVGIVTKVVPLTIPLSGGVSSGFALGNAKKVGVIFPAAVNSTAAFLNVGADASSGSMVRAYVSSGQLSWSISSGPAAFDATDALRGFGFARVELGSPQTALRSFQGDPENIRKAVPWPITPFSPNMFTSSPHGGAN